jgi:hypothetical protein
MRWAYLTCLLLQFATALPLPDPRNMRDEQHLRRRTAPQVQAQAQAQNVVDIHQFGTRHHDPCGYRPSVSNPSFTRTDLDTAYTQFSWIPGVEFGQDAPFTSPLVSLPLNVTRYPWQSSTPPDTPAGFISLTPSAPLSLN